MASDKTLIFLKRKKMILFFSIFTEIKNFVLALGTHLKGITPHNMIICRKIDIWISLNTYLGQRVKEVHTLLAQQF